MRLCTFSPFNEISYGLVKGDAPEAALVDLRRHFPGKDTAGRFSQARASLEPARSDPSS